MIVYVVTLALLLQSVNAGNGFSPRFLIALFDQILYSSHTSACNFTTPAGVKPVVMQFHGIATDWAWAGVDEDSCFFEAYSNGYRAIARNDGWLFCHGKTGFANFLNNHAESCTNCICLPPKYSSPIHSFEKVGAIFLPLI